MFTKQQLITMMNHMFLNHFNDIVEVYEKYKELGCPILAAAMSSSISFKYIYYNLEHRYYWLKENRKKANAMPNIDKLQDSYTKEALIEELKKLPQKEKQRYFFYGAFMPEEFPIDFYDAFLKSFESKEELKQFVEKYPGDLNCCGMYNHTIWLKAFIDAGVNVRISYKGDKNNDETLYWAADKGFVESMKLLLDAGCMLSSKILKAAAESGNPEAVKLCASYGANFSDEVSSSGLIKEVEEGNTEMIRVLLQSGADPSVEGYKAFNIAYKKMIRGKTKEKYKTIYELLQYYHEQKIITSAMNHQMQPTSDDEMKL